MSYLSVRSNAQLLSRQNSQRARAWQTSVARAMAASASSALSTARTLSSGTISRRASRRAGYYYARRHLTLKGRRRKGAPRLAQPAYIINKQKGLFYRGWRTEIVGGALNPNLVIKNVSRRAKWMRGTSVMIERPVLAEVRRRERSGHVLRLQQAKRAALKGTT